ncbi:MAG: polyhydroxyalkanoate depolymerase [Holosporales bacterium]|jgi:poly(3-hydroxybutyrate) depolymerase|nr:polyhydroxyalkanoate depolymerase [Holosporales bacterium]
MLYHLHDLRALGVIPARSLAVGTQMALLSGPLTLLMNTPGGRLTEGYCDMFERCTRYTKKPSFGISSIEVDKNIYSVCEEMIMEKPFCRLLHFKKQGLPSDKYEPNVLIIAPISGHFATLLRDTVKRMLPLHNVFITDWISACEVPLKHGVFSLDTYLDYLIDFLRAIGQRTHVMAVCQPAVQVMAIAAILEEAHDPVCPITIIPMGGPIDPRRNPTSVNRFAETYSLKDFEKMLALVPLGHSGTGRRVYPGFLQLTAFLNMNPQNHMGKHIQYLEDCVAGREDKKKVHTTFYDEYFSLLDMDGTYFLETIDHIFQRYTLPRGLMTYHGHKIDLCAIEKTALLTLEGEKDDISGPGQTYAAQDLCARLPASKKAHYIQPGVGHYGVFSGSRWRQSIAPKVEDFIRAHDPIWSAEHV